MSLNPIDNASFDIVRHRQEIGLLIFSNLNAQDLAVACLVSKYWNGLVKNEFLLDQLNVKTLFKRVTFIDATVWKEHVDLKKHELSFGDTLVDQRIIISEMKNCLSWSIETIDGINPGITVLTIPKGLSIIKLLKLASKHFLRVNPEFLKKYGAEEVAQSYTIIISNNIMENTRAITAEKQFIQIEKYKGEVPKAIEVITVIILTWLRAEKILYGENKMSTYLICKESWNHHCISVGSFGRLNLYIDSNRCFDVSFYGCAAIKRI